MPLHIQYRPRDLSEFFGNEAMKVSLQSILARSDRPRSFLFAGPSGCGKTTLARIVAREIGCSDHDFQEINVGDTRGIDDARRIISNMHYMPMQGACKVYCLDETQGSTPAFQESLLKALEDTPAHVTFILCTTDPQKLKRTIRTRCSTFDVSGLNQDDMFGFIVSILNREGAELSSPPDPLIGEMVQAIVESAEGSPRQALVTLDQVIDIPDQAGRMAAITAGTKAEASLKALMDILLAKGSWGQASRVLSAFPEGTDWERTRMGVVSWAGKVLLSRGGQQPAVIIGLFEAPIYQTGNVGKAIFCERCWRCLS